MRKKFRVSYEVVEDGKILKGQSLIFADNAKEAKNIVRKAQPGCAVITEVTRL